MVGGLVELDWGKQRRSVSRSYCRPGQGAGMGEGLARPDLGKGQGPVQGASIAGWAGLAGSFGETTRSYQGIASDLSKGNRCTGSS